MRVSERSRELGTLVWPAVTPPPSPLTIKNAKEYICSIRIMMGDNE